VLTIFSIAGLFLQRETAQTSYIQKDYTIKFFQRIQEEYMERIDDMANLTAER
jgi:hypothetical protein